MGYYKRKNNKIDKDKVLSSLIKEDIYEYCNRNVGEQVANALKGIINDKVINF
ncbi:hypothetical protein [Brassicibacter mesophilus]|uniref:hypothetical protein n=1 Tax=Brassicibacter mesophilus TaxID=745119 RepID=UPI003D1EA2B9